MIYDKDQNKPSFLDMMQKGPVVAPCVYDCLSARLVEELGFEAMCLSGGELAASLVGVPDLGLVTQDELVGAVERIANCTRIPMIVDIDTGFGNELNLIRTCKRVAHAGARAVHLEDQVSPKRCGHLRGKQVIPREEYISKVRAAAFALDGTGCILIARTDSYHTLGFEEAVRRCNEAIDAGAQASFIEGIGTVDEVRRTCELVKGHKMYAMLSKGASPAVPFEQLKEWGYDLITMHFASGGAMRGIREVGQKCFVAKSDVPTLEYEEIDARLGGKGFHDLMGLNDWLAIGKTFNDKMELASMRHYGEDEK